MIRDGRIVDKYHKEYLNQQLDDLAAHLDLNRASPESGYWAFWEILAAELDGFSKKIKSLKE